MLAKTKRLLAMVLTVCLIMGFMPVGAAATGGEDPVETREQIGKYYAIDGNGAITGDGSSSSTVLGPEAEDLVRARKTIATVIGSDGKAVENLFDITLEVKTREDLEKFVTTKSTAVTLVIDISNSMKETLVLCNDGSGNTYEKKSGSTHCKHCDQSENSHITKTRMDVAKEAAITFLKNYADNANGGERWVSIVVFASDAYVKQVGGQNWVDAATCDWSGATPDNDITDVIDTIVYAGNQDNGDSLAGGTNMSGGLLIGRNLLNSFNNGRTGDQIITSLYVVMLTDGVPTYHTTDTSSTSFTDTGERGGGSTANATDYGRVYTVIESMKNATPSIETFTIDFNASGKVDSMDVDKWLRTKVATDPTMAYTATNLSGLQIAFETITLTIGAKADAWTITDPMGAAIVFENDYNTANNGFGNNAANYRYFDQATGTIHWNIKKDAASYVDDKTEWNTYRITYRIQLDTLSDSFIKETYMPTNKLTYLEYGFLDADDKPIIDGYSDEYGTRILNLRSPSVCGFAADVSFTKAIANNASADLEDFDFTLTHDSKCCNLGAGWDDSASSASGGSVTFDNVPSGHHYTLSEINLSSDFVPPEPVTVSVSWGKVYFGRDKYDGSYTFTNRYLEPEITVDKMVVAQNSSGEDVVLVNADDDTITDPKAFDINTPIIFRIDFTVENVDLTGIVVNDVMGGGGVLVGPFSSYDAISSYLDPSTTDEGKESLVLSAEALSEMPFAVGTHSLYYYYIATPGDAGTTLTNTVTITGKANGYADVGNTDEEDIDILGPNVAISKSINPTESFVEIDGKLYDLYSHGAYVQYTIRVTNFPDADEKIGTATGLTVSDTMAGKAQGAVILLPGETDPIDFIFDETTFNLLPRQSATITYTVELEGNDDEAALAAYNEYVATQTKIIEDAIADLEAHQAIWDAANAQRAELMDTIDDLQQKIDDLDDSFLEPEPNEPDEPTEVAEPDEAEFTDEGVLDQAAYDQACAEYDQYLDEYAQWVVKHAVYEAEYANWLAEKADFEAYPGKLADELEDAEEALEELRFAWTSEATPENPAPADFDNLDALAAQLTKLTDDIADAIAKLEASEFVPGQPTIVGNTATVESQDFEPTYFDSIEVAVKAKPTAALRLTKEVSLTGGSDYAISKSFLTSAGGPAYYRVTVTNDGTATATGLKVDDTMAGVTDVTISINSGEAVPYALGTDTFDLPAGKTVVITYQVEIPANTSFDARKTHVNTATLYVGDEDISNHAYVDVPAVPYAKLEIEKVIVLKKAEGSGSDVVADSWTYYTDDEVTVEYRVTVRNTGTASGTFTLEDVLAVDVPEFAENAEFTLDRGESKVFYYTLTLSESTRNTATYNMPSGGKTANESESDNANVFIKPIPKAYISLTKDVRLDAEGSSFGDEASATVRSSNGTADFIFRVTITNSGDAAVSVANIADEMIGTGSLLGEDGTKYLDAGQLADMNKPFILQGKDENGNPGTKTFYISATGVPVGEFKNTATVNTGSVETINPLAEVIWNGEIDMIDDSADITVTYRRIIDDNGGGGDDEEEEETSTTTEPITTEPEEEIDTTTPVVDYTEPTTAPAEEEEIIIDDALIDLPATGVLTTPVDPAWTLGALAVLSSLGIIIKMGYKKEEQQ